MAFLVDHEMQPARTNAEPSLILKQESMFLKKNLTTKVVIIREARPDLKLTKSSLSFFGQLYRIF